MTTGLSTEPLLRGLSLSQSFISSTQPELKELDEIKTVLSLIQSNSLNCFTPNSSRIHSFSFSSGRIHCMSLSPSLSLLALGFDTGSVKLWSLQSNTEQFSLSTNQPAVLSVEFSADSVLLCTGASDATIKLWNMQTQSLHATLLGHSKSVFAVAFSNNGKLLASGSEDRTVKLWDLDSLTELASFQGHAGAVRSIAFSPNNRHLASGAVDNTIIIWDVQKQLEEVAFKGHTNWIRCLCFSPNGKALASGSGDNTARIWDLEAKKEKTRLFGHTRSVLSVAFSEDGELLATGSDDCSLRLWSLKEDREEFMLSSHSEAVNSVKFLPDIYSLVSVSDDGSLILWDLTDRSEDLTLREHSSTILTVAFSPDSRLLASGSDDKLIKVWNLVSNSLELTFSGHTGTVLCVCFDPAGSVLASSSSDKMIKIWSIANACEKATLIGHIGPVPTIAFSPAGKLLASGSDDNLVKLWDADLNIEAETLTGHTDCVRAVAFSPDGQILASGSGDRKIKLWQIAGRQLTNTLDGHTHWVRALSFSPDGLFLASGSSDNSIKVWNLSLGIEEVTLMAHKSWVRCLCYSPDGKSLVSGGGDNVLKIWNLKEKREEFAINAHTNWVRAVAFSPDGCKMASGSGDQTVKLWTVNSQENNRLPDSESITNKGFHSLFAYNNALSMISHSEFSKIYAWDVLISSNKYTPLHFAAYIGQTKAIESALEGNRENIRILADANSRSPVYYAIMERHQKVTELLLNFAAERAEEMDFQRKLEMFYAFREDFSLIIQNSSRSLNQFLSVCLFSNNLLMHGAAKTRIQFVDGFRPSFRHFIMETETNSIEPLRIRCSYFKLPSKIGSQSSVALLRAFNESTNKDVFSSKLVKSIVRCKWDALKPFIVIYTLLLWSNLMLLALILSNDPTTNLPYISNISLCSVNGLLFLWEILQIFASGFAYFGFWNCLDMSRSVLTIAFAILHFYFIEHHWLSWVVVLSNVVRGLSGFRAFDRTRYYVKLIYESLLKISFFLFIFVYTTLSFGLLHLAATEGGRINAEAIWIDSFGLVIGDTENMGSNELNAQYLTLMLAVGFNIVLMMNMIISLLGDSFDEFQVLSVYYDNKEMTEIILEIEEIASLAGLADYFQYLHLCENYYLEEEQPWVGKVVDTREQMKQSIKEITNNINETSKKTKNEINESLMENIKGVERGLEGKISKLGDIIMSIGKGQERVVDDLMQMKENTINVENRINSIESQISLLDTKIEKILEFIAK